MIPSVGQLRGWATIEGDHGEWIRLPSSAWIEVLWLLERFEQIEDNPAVRAAFAEAGPKKPTVAEQVRRYYDLDAGPEADKSHTHAEDSRAD